MSLSDLQSRIAVIISADGSGAIREIQKVGQSADKDLGKATENIDKLGNRLTYGGAAAMGFAAMAGGALYSFAKASDEAHQYEVKLQNSMRNSPVLANANIESFKKLAQAIQGKTAADGDQVLGSMAVLAQFRLTEQQIKTVTPLVVDYARKMGVDLDTAAKNVGKALDGKATALQKSGIKLDENIYKTDRLTAVVNGLRGTVGGFAEQEGQTFSGKLERFKNQMNDLKESIGSGVISTIGPLASGLGKVAQGASEVNDKTGGMVGTIATVGVGVIGLGGAVSFLSGQFIKLRAQMIAAEGGLTMFGNATAIMAAVGVGALMDAGIGKLQHSMDNLKVDTRAMHDEMSKFASSGTVSGGLDKTIKDTGTLGHQVKMVGDESYKAGHSMNANILSIQGTVGNAVNAVKAIPSAFSEGIDNLSKGKFKLVDTLNLWSSSSKESQVKIKALDDQLTQLAQSGHAEAAAEMFQKLSKSAKDGGASQGDVNKAFKSYIEIAKTAKDSTADQTRNYETFGSAVRLADMALEDQLKTENELAMQHASLELAQLRAEDAYKSFIEKQQDGTLTGNALREAQIELGQQFFELSNKAADAASEQAHFTDKTQDAKLRVDTQISTLEELKKKFPAMAPEIDGYLSKLNEIKSNITTDVRVNTGSAEEQLQGILRQLRELQGFGLPIYVGGNLHLPGRAVGGPVMAGQAYVVGERGPELMVPNANGTIIPNNALRAYNPGSSTYNVTVNVASGTHPADVGSEVVNAIKAYERRNGTAWRN